MKRFKITFLFLVGLLIQMHAQLTVADDNNVGIGETTPASELSINGEGNTYSTLYVENNTTTSINVVRRLKKAVMGTMEAIIPFQFGAT